MGTTTAELKAQHRDIRDGYPEALRMRIHRALRWLTRAEVEMSDDDARFVFQWIALNAAYSREFDFSRDGSERDRVRSFCETLVALDAKKRLHHALFQQFSGPICDLIENKFTFEPFWRAVRTHDSSNQWETRFASNKRAALATMKQNDTVTVLSIVFDRLYVLRNQLVHGGSTWNSDTNRV